MRTRTTRTAETERTTIEERIAEATRTLETATPTTFGIELEMTGISRKTVSELVYNYLQSKEIRSIVENQISDSPDDIAWLCPIKLPMDVRLVMREEYDKYDYSTRENIICLSYISLSWFSPLCPISDFLKSTCFHFAKTRP